MQACIQIQRSDQLPGARMHVRVLAPCSSGSFRGMSRARLANHARKQHHEGQKAGRRPAWPGAPSKGDSPGPAAVARTAWLHSNGKGQGAGGAPINDRFWSMMKYSRPRMGYASVWSARPGQPALGAQHRTSRRCITHLSAGRAEPGQSATPTAESMRRASAERRLLGATPRCAPHGAAAQRLPARGTRHGLLPLRRQAAATATAGRARCGRTGRADRNASPAVARDAQARHAGRHARAEARRVRLPEVARDIGNRDQRQARALRPAQLHIPARGAVGQRRPTPYPIPPTWPPGPAPHACRRPSGLNSGAAAVRTARDPPPPAMGLVLSTDRCLVQRLCCPQYVLERAPALRGAVRAPSRPAVRCRHSGLPAPRARQARRAPRREGPRPSE